MAALMTVVVLAAIGDLATRLSTSSHGRSVSNAELLGLVHSASSAITRTPASTFTMTMAMSVRGVHQSLHMSGFSNTRNHESSIAITGPGVSEQTVAVGGVSYLRLPSQFDRLNQGKPWIAMPAVTPTPQQQQLAGAGPAGMLQALSAVGGPVVNEGLAEVRGVGTTEYSLHIDGLRLFGSRFDQVFGAGATARLKRFGFGHLPATVWIDRNGVVRKFVLTAAAPALSIVETAYLTPKSGNPTVTAPPRTQVRMMKSLKQFGKVFRRMLAST